MSVLSANVPAATSKLTVVIKRGSPHAEAARSGFLVRDDKNGHYFQRKGLILSKPWERPIAWQQKLLAFLRDHVNKDLPSAYRRAVLGHDAHISAYSELFFQHWHAHERDPFTGEMGWLENLGRVSDQKVTTAFRNFITAQLVTESSLFGDFKYHEVGTDATAESNAQTALIVSTGIARVAGTQVDGTGTYTSVGVVTADATETWQEHGLFNAAAAGTMLDRSVLSPTASVVSGDTGTFTHVTTFNAEA